MKKFFVLSITIFIATNAYGMQPAAPAPAWQQWFSSWVPWAQHHWQNIQNIQNIYNTQGFAEVCKTYPVTTAVVTFGLGCGAIYAGYNYFSLKNQLMRAIQAGRSLVAESLLKQLVSDVSNARAQTNFKQIKKDALDLCTAAFEKAFEQKANIGESTYEAINNAIADIEATIKSLYPETPQYAEDQLDGSITVETGDTSDGDD